MQAAAVAQAVWAPRPLQAARSRPQHFACAAPQRRAAGRQLAVSVRAEAASPPTVADAKAKFVDAFKKPLPAIYSTIVQELLVQQHLFRWNRQYQYSEVTALGIVSIFDQILDGLPDGEREAVFNAFVNALEEDPEKYRKDAAAMEEWARSQTAITPDASGDAGQQALAAVAAATSEGKFLYTKFFAVGLFRLVELTGSKDPKTLTGLVKALGLSQERVNADLMTYKGVLSKLEAAKEIMKEFIAREKKKQAEREAEKAAKAAAKAEAAEPAQAAPTESTA